MRGAIPSARLTPWPKSSKTARSADQAIDHIVVGLPLQLNGSEGKSAKKARRWAANLAKRLATLSEDESSPDS
jgi:RNase H-fold protein (predicted Holliday junction resolvase)